MEVVFSLANKITVLHRGAVIADGTLGDQERCGGAAGLFGRFRLMLRIDSLNAHYGASHILQGVDLALGGPRDYYVGARPQRRREDHDGARGDGAGAADEQPCAAGRGRDQVMTRKAVIKSIELFPALREPAGNNRGRTRRKANSTAKLPIPRRSLPRKGSPQQSWSSRSGSACFPSRFWPICRYRRSSTELQPLGRPTCGGGQTSGRGAPLSCFCEPGRHPNTARTGARAARLLPAGARR
jgi:hypothetical protein